MVIIFRTFGLNKNERRGKREEVLDPKGG